MAQWYPPAMSYSKFKQAESFKSDITDAMDRNTADIATRLDNGNKLIIATAEQAKAEINGRLDRIAQINEQGFKDVTNAIQEIGAAICWRLDVVSAQLENISSTLKDIHYTLKKPNQTRVQELYDDACQFIRQGLFQEAIIKLQEALLIDDTSLLCCYQLGLLRLEGVNNFGNEIKIEDANKFLRKASRLAEGKSSVDSKFTPFLANCLFFTSQSFYFKLPPENFKNDPNLDEAIVCAEKAIKYNPQLSQAHYFLAKYYCIKGETSLSLSYLKRAIFMDKIYCIECTEDAAFDSDRGAINKLLDDIKLLADIDAAASLNRTSKYLSELEKYKLPDTIYESEIIGMRNDFGAAKEQHNTGSYFGYLSSLSISKKINDRFDSLKKEIDGYLKELESKKDSLPKAILGVIGATAVVSVYVGLGLLPTYLIIWVVGSKKTADHFALTIVVLIAAVFILMSIFGWNSDFKQLIDSKKKKYFNDKP